MERSSVVFWSNVRFAVQGSIAMALGAAWCLHEDTKSIFGVRFLVPVLALVASRSTAGESLIVGIELGAAMVASCFFATIWCSAVGPSVVSVLFGIGIFGFFSSLSGYALFRKMGTAIAATLVLRLSGGWDANFETAMGVLGASIMGLAAGLIASVTPLPFVPRRGGRCEVFGCRIGCGGTSAGDAAFGAVETIADAVEQTVTALALPGGVTDEQNRERLLQTLKGPWQQVRGTLHRGKASVLFREAEQWLSDLRQAATAASWDDWMQCRGDHVRRRRQQWTHQIQKSYRIARQCATIESNIVNGPTQRGFAKLLGPALMEYTGVITSVLCEATELIFQGVESAQDIARWREKLRQASLHLLDAYSHTRFQVLFRVEGNTEHESKIPQKDDGDDMVDDLFWLDSIPAGRVEDVIPIAAFVFTLLRFSKTLDGALSPPQNHPPPDDRWHWPTLDPLPMKRAVRFATAVIVATAVGYIPSLASDYANWAAVTVAFVAGDSLGGSFHTSLLRVQGTVAGAIFGYVLVSLSLTLSSASAAALQGIGLCLFSGIGMYLATNPWTGYSGLVGAFTAGIIVLGVRPPGLTAEEFATIRIEQTLIGVLVYLVVANTIFPEFASTQALFLTRRALDAAANGVHAVTADARAWLHGGVMDEKPVRSHHVESLEMAQNDLEAASPLAQLALSEPTFYNPPFPTLHLRDLHRHAHGAIRALRVAHKAVHTLADQEHRGRRVRLRGAMASLEPLFAEVGNEVHQSLVSASQALQNDQPPSCSVLAAHSDRIFLAASNLEASFTRIARRHVLPAALQHSKKTLPSLSLRQPSNTPQSPEAPPTPLAAAPPGAPALPSPPSEHQRTSILPKDHRPLPTSEILAFNTLLFSIQLLSLETAHVIRMANLIRAGNP